MNQPVSCFLDGCKGSSPDQQNRKLQGMMPEPDLLSSRDVASK